jgi:hypothetical protein
MFKFRMMGLSITIMLLIMSFFSVTAQQGGSGAPTAVPTTNPDRDGDGIPNSADNCPRQRGPSSNGGCPEDSSNNGSGNSSGSGGGNQADTDGDGLGDPNDQCPTVPGTAANNGCPDGTEEPCTGQTGTPNCDTPDPCTARASTPSCDPTEPPPTDACYVSTAERGAVNVRSEMKIDPANIVGIIPGPGIWVQATIRMDENGNLWAELLDLSSVTLADPTFPGPAYASMAVLVYSNCQIPTVPGDDAVGQNGTGDLVAGDTPICHMALGFDADVWGSADEGMGHVIYAYFWFAFPEGAPIPEGTVNAGVSWLEPTIDFDNPESAYAVATDPNYFEEAQNADYGGDYGWPTLAGGIQSGAVILPRIEELVGVEGDGTGHCGPIVPANADDLSTNTGNDAGSEIQIPIDDLVCTVTTSSFHFAFAAPAGTPLAEGAQPIAILYPEPQEGTDLWEDPNLWSLIRHFDGKEYMYYEGTGYDWRLGGTCGPLLETEGQTISEPASTEAPTLQRPINQLACTVTTALGWIFAFNKAPGQPLDLGSHPLAVLQGHPAFDNTPAIWSTLEHDFNGHTVEYMGISRDIEGWVELPRTGGTCGAMGGSEPSVFVFPNDIGRSGDGNLEFDIVVDFPDCNNNGENDLDEFLPPDCFGQLTTTNGDNVVEFPGFDDTDTEIAWLQCPDGWTWSEEDGFACAPLVVDDED